MVLPGFFWTLFEVKSKVNQQKMKALGSKTNRVRFTIDFIIRSGALDSGLH